MPEHQRLKPGAMRLWAPVVAYMAFIFALSSIAEPPALPSGADKRLHALLYTGFGVLLARALAGGWRGVGPRVVLQSVVLGALYGASDELHQYFNPPRAMEALDVLADTIGSGAGAVGLYAWGIIQGRDGV